MTLVELCDAVIKEIKQKLIRDINNIILEYVNIHTLAEKFKSKANTFRNDFCNPLFKFKSKEDDDIMIDLLHNKYWELNNIEEESFILTGNPDFGRKVFAGITGINNKFIQNKSAGQFIMPSYFYNNFILCLKINKLLDIKDIIRRVELEIGGYRIDVIYGNVFDILYELHQLKFKITHNDDDIYYHYEIPIPFDAVVNKKAIPLLYFNEIRLNFEFTQQSKDIHMIDAEVLCNELTVIPKIETCELTLEKPFRTPIIQLQFTGSETMIAGASKYETKLFFNHEIYCIFLHFETYTEEQLITEEILDNIDLYIDHKVYLNKFKPKMISNLPGKYIIPLHDKNLINFSTMDWTNRLILNLKKPLESHILVSVYALSINGLAYKCSDGKYNKSGLCYGS
ncbi:MAG: hypothetical protein Edafosvirus2_75 [Edafosvirus sp.]|uniref:Uncharacterized protein n=1 Tax=Edafosvirus sp. TaxID=2487765 RepID=A0A3G4ZSM2_9VIRU|nr:MAG: hypothetical protein Edafosvirus2_75 [Edafosvirus sp.]